MKTVSKDQNNIGGIARIWLIPNSIISALPSSQVVGQYIMPVEWGRDAWELFPIFQSASLAIKNLRTSAGSYWESTISFSLPKFDLTNESYVYEFNNHLWCLLLLDQNGQWILVGDANFPMRLDVDTKTGSDISDLNNLQFTFVNKSPFRPLFVDKPF